MRKVYIFTLMSICTVLLSLCNCSKSDNGAGDSKKDKDSVLVYSFSKPEYVFGFVNQNRYSYCPSVLQQDDGSKHIYFCGNPNQNIMVDNIYHIVENPDGTRTQAVSVLQPSLSWDSRHTCDPSVIQGEFGYDGVNYKYAMFFLSNPLEYYYNEIGVAFSNDLNAKSWVKYPTQIVTKTWSQDGDQSLGGSARSWGVGQPSAVSLDKKGKVLLTYTVGDAAGTRVAFSVLDMSDMSKFIPVTGTDMNKTGLYMLDGKTEDTMANCDFAINLEENKVVMSRPVHPFSSSYPNYIASVLEIDTIDLDSLLDGIGKWTMLGRIDQSLSDFPRNHNAGVMRDNFGHIKEWDTPTVYFTVSKEAPQVTPENGRHAEWTYHIYKTSISKNYRYFDKRR